MTSDSNHEIPFSIKFNPDIPKLRQSLPDLVDLHLELGNVKASRPLPLKKKAHPNLLKPDKFKDLITDLHQLNAQLNAMIYDEVQDDWQRFAVRNDERVLKVADSLFRMAVENRWMHRHEKGLADAEALCDVAPNLEEHVPRAMKVKHRLKNREFVACSDYGGDVDDYVAKMKPTAWMNLFNDRTKSMRSLRNEMFKLDHDACEIQRWKASYYESSVQIERLACLNYTLLTCNPDDEVFANFQEYCEVKYG